MPLLDHDRGAVAHVQPARVKAIAPLIYVGGFESPVTRASTLVTFYILGSKDHEPFINNTYLPNFDHFIGRVRVTYRQHDPGTTGVFPKG